MDFFRFSLPVQQASVSSTSEPDRLGARLKPQTSWPRHDAVRKDRLVSEERWDCSRGRIIDSQASGLCGDALLCWRRVLTHSKLTSVDTVLYG